MVVCAAAVTLPSAEPTTSLEEVVEDYIRTYQERKDWNKLLSFYSDSLNFQDVNLGMDFASKSAFEEFYDWPNPDFQKLSPEQKHFEVEDLVVLNNQAIIRGHFNPFYWKGQRQDWADGFVIWLYFNQDQKIIRQYDFVKYPAWILETMEPQEK